MWGIDRQEYRDARASRELRKYSKSAEGKGLSEKELSVIELANFKELLCPLLLPFARDRNLFAAYPF